MNAKEMEAAAVRPAQSPDNGVAINNTMSILTNLPADVKALRDLRTERHIPVVDIVEIVASIYPKFDRYLLSKAEHGNEYGIRLRADAYRELMEHFRITGKERREEKRRKPMRVSCRLTEKAYGLFRQELERTGMTMQGFLEALIVRVIVGDVDRREKTDAEAEAAPALH